jgi:predicted ArsR family transcriptional regulator
MCTFWYVEALARAGSLDQARLVFAKMLTYANHLGLYAEEIGPTGEQLGNFPEAFTHLALGVERAGRELGRELHWSKAGSEAEEAMGRTLTALGLAAQCERIKAGRVVFRPGKCHYRDAVRENQPVVCALHRGLIRGLLDELEPSACC